MESRIMKSIVFKYPRFAIKSYGKEKRYLCPPPHLSMKGKGWDEYLAFQQQNNQQQESTHFGSNGHTVKDTNGHISDTDPMNDSERAQQQHQDQYYSIISIPGVDLSESGNIEFDENVIQ